MPLTALHLHFYTLNTGSFCWVGFEIEKRKAKRENENWNSRQVDLGKIFSTISWNFLLLLLLRCAFIPLWILKSDEIDLNFSLGLVKMEKIFHNHWKGLSTFYPIPSPHNFWPWKRAHFSILLKSQLDHHHSRSTSNFSSFFTEHHHIALIKSFESF